MKKHSLKTSLHLSAEIIRTLSATELVAARGAGNVAQTQVLYGNAQPNCSDFGCSNKCLTAPPP